MDSKLTVLAERAAETVDSLDSVSREHAAVVAELMTDPRVVRLGGLMGQLRHDFEVLCADLLERMTAAAVDAIPLHDRAAVELKLIPGRKGQPTKKFLVEELGKAQATALWEKIPVSSDKTIVVVPSRANTPPSS